MVCFTFCIFQIFLTSTLGLCSFSLFFFLYFLNFWFSFTNYNIYFLNIKIRTALILNYVFFPLHTYIKIFFKKEHFNRCLFTTLSTRVFKWPQLLSNVHTDIWTIKFSLLVILKVNAGCSSTVVRIWITRQINSKNSFFERQYFQNTNFILHCIKCFKMSWAIVWERTCHFTMVYVVHNKTNHSDGNNQYSQCHQQING